KAQAATGNSPAMGRPRAAMASVRASARRRATASGPPASQAPRADLAGGAPFSPRAAADGKHELSWPGGAGAPVRPYLKLIALLVVSHSPRSPGPPGGPSV